MVGDELNLDAGLATVSKSCSISPSLFQAHFFVGGSSPESSTGASTSCSVVSIRIASSLTDFLISSQADSEN